MQFLQSKSPDFMLKEFKGRDYVLKTRIKVIKEDEIGCLDINDNNYDLIATPSVYNCSIIVALCGDLIFLAHITSKRTFKEFFSVINREIILKGMNLDSELRWFYDKPYELRGDKNSKPSFYNSTLKYYKIVGDESLDFSYFVNKEGKIVKQRRRYFYDITYDDFN